MTRRNITLIAVALAMSWQARAATVTITESTTYQTIEGFGAFGGLYPTWARSPLFTDAFVNTVVNDLGISMTRYDYSTGTEVMNFFKKLKEYGMERIIISTWSPPANWKSNGSEVNGGSLLPEYYDDFANLCATTIRTIKQQTGIDVYGISLQNEPAFVETYTSCVYTATQYRDLVKVAGPIIHAEFPNVKLFGAEDMLARWTASGAFPGPLMSDTASRRQMGALAVHGYSDGVHPTPASVAASMWSRAATNCASVGKPLWMTETSGYQHDTWSECLQLSEMIYAALKFGKISAWVWWQLSEAEKSPATDDRYSLMSDGNPTKAYYVSKQFYRYIRPNAVQVLSACDDTLVYPVAFKHTADRTFTVVLVNSASSEKSVTLAGGGPASYRAYRTSASQNCADAGTVSAGSVTLPASSVTTLYAQDYATGVAGPAAGAALPGARAHAPAARAYAIDGRRVTGRASAPGVRAIAVGVSNRLKVTGMQSVSVR